MSVDKAKDTSPKKPITENKIVEAKPESSTKTENKPDATPKKQGMGEGQKPVSKAYKDNWNKIFGKKKKRLHLSSTTRGDLCSRGSFSVVVRWRCWERLPMLMQVVRSTLGQRYHGSSFHPAMKR